MAQSFDSVFQGFSLGDCWQGENTVGLALASHKGYIVHIVPTMKVIFVNESGSICTIFIILYTAANKKS